MGNKEFTSQESKKLVHKILNTEITKTPDITEDEIFLMRCFGERKMFLELPELLLPR